MTDFEFSLKEPWTHERAGSISVFNITFCIVSSGRLTSKSRHDHPRSASRMKPEFRARVPVSTVKPSFVLSDFGLTLFGRVYHLRKLSLASEMLSAATSWRLGNSTPVDRTLAGRFHHDAEPLEGK